MLVALRGSAIQDTPMSYKVNRLGGTTMISDVLSETVNNLDHYLSDPKYDDTYTGDVRDRIVRLRNEAKAIRDILDISPRPESA